MLKNRAVDWSYCNRSHCSLKLGAEELSKKASVLHIRNLDDEVFCGMRYFVLSFFIVI